MNAWRRLGREIVNALMFWDPARSPKAVKLRAEAMLSLRGICVPSADGRYALIASQAEIVEQTENLDEYEGRVKAIYVTQVVRNPEGEYFLLKSTGAKPYVKHLSQSRAQHVLKAKYKAPAAAS